MLRGKEKVLEWFDFGADANYLVWKICHGRNQNYTIASNATKEDGEEGDPISSVKALKVTRDSARDTLNKALDFLEPGDYIIATSSRLNGQWGKGQRLVYFTIPGERGAVGATQTIAGGYTKEQVDSLVAAALDKYKAVKELEDIKKQLDELKNSTGDRRWDKFFEAVKPHMGDIVGALTGKEPTAPAQVGISGFHNGKGDTKDEQDRLEKALERLNAARPNDILELIELLSDTAEKNPGTIDMLKTMAK